VKSREVHQLAGADPRLSQPPKHRRQCTHSYHPLPLPTRRQAVIPLKDVKERVPLLLDGPTHLCDASIINEYVETK